MLTAPVWIFDLDNTLHDANPHIFPLINQAMTDYMQRELALDSVQANKLRQQYWLRYGATLLGLVRHHRVDPEHFLWHTHPLPALLEKPRPMSRLRATLRRLPGRKIVFSNGPRHYVEALLQALGVADLFMAVLTPQDCGYWPKPYGHGYRRLLRRYRLQARRCVMVEDSLVNLQPAKRLGMRTVWLARGARQSPWADGKLGRLADLPARWRTLLRWR